MPKKPKRTVLGKSLNYWASKKKNVHRCFPFPSSGQVIPACQRYGLLWWKMWSILWLPYGSQICLHIKLTQLHDGLKPQACKEMSKDVFVFVLWVWLDWGWYKTNLFLFLRRDYLNRMFHQNHFAKMLQKNHCQVPERSPQITVNKKITTGYNLLILTPLFS